MHTQTTAPARDSQAPDWIDYKPAEAALFEAVRPDLKLIAADHAHQFGADVAELVDQVAEAAYPKASAAAGVLGIRRVFGDKHLFVLCRRWSPFWCNHYAEREQRKAARQRNAADRSDYQRRRGARGLRTQRRRMDGRALQCQIMKFQGLTAKQIAAAVGCSVRTVKSDYRRPVDTGLFAAAIRPRGGVQSAKEVLVRPKNLVPSTEPPLQVAPPENVDNSPPEPPPPDSPEGAKILAELRALWGKTDGKAYPHEFDL